MAVGNYIPVIHAGQGILYYVTDASSLAYGSALDTLVAASNQVIMCKDLTLAKPQTKSEVFSLLGNESTTRGTGVPNTGVYQNAIMDFKSTTEGKVSGKLILTLANDGANSNQMPDFINMATGTGQAISTTHHRHTFGDSTSGQTQVLTGAIFIIWDNGVTSGTALLHNPTVNIGEISLTGSDGHWEISFEANCLPKNYALETEDRD